MTSRIVVSCWNLLPCLFALLLTTRAVRRNFDKNKIPPSEIDENGCMCDWTPWMNNDDFNPQIGDDTTYENLRQKYKFCLDPKDIKCRSKYLWNVPYDMLQKKDTVCSVDVGSKCTSRPFRRLMSLKEKPHYCDDYEITVKCCSCPTTTLSPETTAAVTTETTESVNSSDKAPPDDLLDKQFGFLDSNVTEGQGNGTIEGVTLAVILIAVFGCLIIIGFIIVIYLILSKSRLKKRRPSIPSCYQEVLRDFISATPLTADPSKVQFSFAQPSGSSDYRTTSSDDEGYRSRPSYNNRKRRTKGQRDRKLNNGNRFGHTSDSLEFPTLDSRSPAEENSDDGRFRKWFPDEYERAMEQKQRQQQQQQHQSKTRMLFSAPRNAFNRKSIPYADSES